MNGMVLETNKTWTDTILPKFFHRNLNPTPPTKPKHFRFWERVSCIGHNLNMAEREIVAMERKVVDYFHRSSLTTRNLKEKQKRLLPPEVQGHNN